MREIWMTCDEGSEYDEADDNTEDFLVGWPVIVQNTNIKFNILQAH